MTILSIKSTLFKILGPKLTKANLLRSWEVIRRTLWWLHPIFMLSEFLAVIWYPERHIVYTVWIWEYLRSSEVIKCYWGYCNQEIRKWPRYCLKDRYFHEDRLYERVKVTLSKNGHTNGTLPLPFKYIECLNLLFDLKNEFLDPNYWWWEPKYAKSWSRKAIHRHRVKRQTVKRQTVKNATKGQTGHFLIQQSLNFSKMDTQNCTLPLPF